MHIGLKVKIFTGGDPVLQLKDIVKKYGSGENIVTALDGALPSAKVNLWLSSVIRAAVRPRFSTSSEVSTIIHRETS